jgi:hypothetical protein
MEELLASVFSVQFVSMPYTEKQLRLRESLETAVRKVGDWCEMAACLGVVCDRVAGQYWREHGSRESSLYNFGADRTEYTTSNNPSVVVMAVAYRQTGYHFRENVPTDHCLETGVCLPAYCTATALLVRFEVSSQQRVCTLQYNG